LAVVGALAAALALAPGAGAIGNGVPDGNGHPNVGLLAVGVEEDGELVRFGLCSGSYGGPQVGQPAEKVFVTARHCVNWLPEEGVPADQLWVTFDSATTTDPDTDAITSSNTWHQASGIGFDPAPGDYGVVLLESVPPNLAPVQLATAGLLDKLTARAGSGPRPSSTTSATGSSRASSRDRRNSRTHPAASSRHRASRASRRSS
jgi:hypothetical protein